jgi:hypothetical protein
VDHQEGVTVGISGTFRIQREITTNGNGLTLQELSDACVAALQEGIPGRARVIQVATIASHPWLHLELDSEWRRRTTGDSGAVGD